MPKVATMALVRKRPKAETRTFTDPEQPGVEWTLTMAASDILTASRMEEAAEALKAEYLEGEDGPEPFPLLQEQEGGIGALDLSSPVESLFLNEKLIESAVGMWACQAGPEAERYTPKEMVAAALTMPNAYQDAMAWVGELNQKKGAALGNSPSGAASAPSAAPPSSSSKSTPPLHLREGDTDGVPTSEPEASTDGSAPYSGILVYPTPVTMAPERTSRLPLSTI